MRWQDGSAFSFQKFTSRSFSKNPYLTTLHPACRSSNSHELCTKSGLQTNKTKQVFHPLCSETKHCTFMLLYNLVAPEWVKISCTESLSKYFICMTNKNIITKPNQWNTAPTDYCLFLSIKHQNYCFYFLWHGALEKNIFRWPNLKPYPLVNMSQLSFLFHSVKPSTICSQFLTHRLVFKFDKFRGSYMKKQVIGECQGYKIYFDMLVQKTPGRNVFQCNNGILLSAMNVWNGIFDCTDKSDEIICNLNLSCQLLKKMVKISILKQKYPLAKDNPENGATKVSDICMYCGAQCQKLSAAMGHCKDPQYFPCGHGDPECYQISDLCVYKMNKFGIMVPCWNGEQLKSCKEFECNAMFKCPKYYCIPWEYVCDNKWDCPQGTEEASICSSINCTSMFKCIGKNNICLHLKSLCDNVQNCPHGDDELLCDLDKQTCHTHCQCVMYAIICVGSNFTANNKLELPNFHSLFLMKISLSETSNINIYEARYCSLVDIQMKVSCDLISGKNLILMKVFLCYQPLIQKHCYKNSPRLTDIQLSSNKISQLESEAFANLRDLKVLNLSNNHLENFPEDLFCSCIVLHSLSLHENKVKTIKANTFLRLFVVILETRDFHLCCLTSAATFCNAPKPSYVSCSDLLPNDIFRVFYVLISASIILLTVTSIMLYKFQLSKNATTIIPIFINLNESLCGYYLSIIWIADLIYKNKFILQEAKWRSSAPCHVASGIFLMFNILDPMLLFHLSFSRFMIVIDPINSNYKASRFTLRSVLFLFIPTAIIITTTSLAIYLLQESIPTSLCLYFVDPANFAWSTKVLTGLVTFVQFSATAGICVIHNLLVQGAKKSKKLSKSKPTTWLTSLLVQLYLISLSNILCWIPTNIIYIVSLTMSQYPTELIIWTAAALVPLNSVINPIVFISTSVRSIHRQGRHHHSSFMDTNTRTSDIEA